MSNGVYGAGMNVAIAGATQAQGSNPIAVTGATGGSSSPVITAPFNASSVAVAGKATAPTAGTNIATETITTAGTYEIQIWVAVSGTATTAAADSNNMEFLIGSTPVTAFLPYNCSTAGNLTNAGPFQFQEILAANAVLNVNAVANATAGTVYSAMIIATRVA